MTNRKRPQLRALAGGGPPLEPGGVVWFWGRPLRVVAVSGQAPGDPVILEEAEAVGDGLPGQLALWEACGARSARWVKYLPPEKQKARRRASGGPGAAV
jgi:hypothetical protein